MKPRIHLFLKHAYSYLSKPVTPTDLIREIMRFLPHTEPEKRLPAEAPTEGSYELAGIKENTELVAMLRQEIPALKEELRLKRNQPKSVPPSIFGCWRKVIDGIILRA